MKFSIGTILCCVVLSLTGHTHPDTTARPFELEGSIDLITTPKAYLIYNAGGKVVRDTATIIDGVFRFTGRIYCPTYSQIWSDDYKYGTALYLESNKMTIGLAGADKHLVVTGSVTDGEYEPLRREYVLYNFKVGSKKGTEEVNLIRTEMIVKIKFFIREHPRSYVSLQELTALSPGLDQVELLSLFEGLDKQVRESDQGITLVKKVETIRQTEIGMPARDFVQKGADGRDIALHDLKGKYVLIDFWASWCGPCRLENPNLVKTWRKFKDKNIVILGVSLDEKEDKWKEAIEKDRLNWLQVSDLKGWGNTVALQYAVSSIPANFLVDPDGMIIARNLRGQELERKLYELFK